MEAAITPPNQRARYVAIEEPVSVEGYVDELVQTMGYEGLRLFQVVPMRRGGDTVGFWLFFSEVAIPVQQTAAHHAIA
jgi:hypothetical protein